MPKRKTSKLPTKVFKYEIGPPFVGALLVDEQIRKSGHYQNDIVGLTNQGREEYREERAKRFPRYPRCEAKIKEETKATTRCLPADQEGLPASPAGASAKEGKCVYCGKPAKYQWIFAQAY